MLAVINAVTKNFATNFSKKKIKVTNGFLINIQETCPTLNVSFHMTTTR